MKIFHRKPSANFPQTSTWGITATKFAIVIALGLHDVVIELPQRKLTKHAPDAGYARKHLSTTEADTLAQVKASPAPRR